jgi:S-adenosylmethionine-diacylglycerol 3-amino-3-carboxypropyl transferase
MDDTPITEKAAFNFIRYASVWEDADILCEALRPSCHSGRILSIASSGDNALALLTLDPAEVVAADLNPAQLACVELRMAGFRHLDHGKLLAFLGVTPTEDRLKTYQSLRLDLSEKAKSFWDKYPTAIQDGIIHMGKFEKYLRFFGTKILPWIHNANMRGALLKMRPLHEQSLFYEKKWDTFWWRLFFKVFFSKTIMGWFGRDPAFFDHVEGTVSSRILSRTKHALTQLPTYNNPYLVYILTGNYSGNALPCYLRPENKDVITSRLDRMTLFEGPAQEASSGHFDGFNLSDIFEYMNESEYERCYRDLVNRANLNARLAYWNMLVPRSAPDSLQGKVSRLDEISTALYFHDKAWFYQAFIVDEVVQTL